LHTFPRRILPVFIPFAGCRNRCVYCNQNRITGTGSGSLLENASRQISDYLSYSDKWDELAFYGGSFTCIPQKDRLALYELAREKGFDRLRFSTSPDCVGNDVLDEAEAFGVRTVELGVQSLSDGVLSLNKRPYDAETCLKAIKSVSRRFITGVQMMTGMYGETAADVANTADSLAALKPAYARIYPTVVLADTELAELYKTDCYIPPTPAEMLLRTAYAYAALTSAGTNVIRTGLQSTDSLEDSIKGGFYHPAFGDMVKTLIILIFLHNYGEIYASQADIHKFFGYKSLARKHFPDKIIIGEDFQTSLPEICLKAKEHIFENNGRNPERNSASYAEELIRQTHNR
jgi:histone acetyltransferase (RNA polymerase elongator complex component)